MASLPRNEDAGYREGLTALGNQAFSDAARAFRRALAHDPSFASAAYGLGLSLHGLGDTEAALVAMQCAVDLKHDYVPALFHAGEWHRELGHTDDARDCFSLALTFDPLSSASRIALARILGETEGLDSAIVLLREAVDTRIADSAVYCGLADWLTRSGRVEDAVSIYQSAIDAFPADPGPPVNLGMVYLAYLGDPSRAEALFRRAIAVAPGSIEAQANLGLALQEQGRFDEAIQHLAVQISAHPTELEFRWNRGLANLLQGYYEIGWEDYELRKRRPDGAIHRNYTFPEWDGSPLFGKTILVYGEQGLGDEIMFSSCLPEVVASAGKTVVECDSRLVGLFRRSFPATRIEGRTQSHDCKERYTEVDVQSAIGSLPRYFRRFAAEFPLHCGYLVPDPTRVRQWKERLDAFGPGLKVGISWRSGTFKTRGPLRSIPLGDWLPLLSLDGIHFISLQRSGSGGEMEDIQTRHGVSITAFPEVPRDMEETAALITALDLIVCSDSTIAHLGGALGRRCWILLPSSPDWRYQWRGEGMPWYPNARLFRQGSAGDWTRVIREVAQALIAARERI